MSAFKNSFQLLIVQKGCGLLSTEQLICVSVSQKVSLLVGS